MGAKASSIAMANAITGIGYSLKELNKVDEATTALDGAIDLLRDSKHPFLVDTLRTKASWYGEQGNWLKALNTYVESAQINEVDSNREFYARDLIAIANCYHELGNWSETITYALKAREIFKERKMVVEISWCDLNIADSHAELHDGEQAIFWGRKANDIGVLRKDDEVICKSNYVMARGYKLLEKYQDAENLLLVAQELVARSADWTQITKIEKELSIIYRLTNRDTDAEEVERRLCALTEIVQ
jgi:tetratricopeptide (TPR) repeat protein